jgi:2-oxoglutarate ferredoxin oxidoreductase subunit alpha
MGRHSYYDVRAGTEPIHAHRDMVDVLVSFEPETLARHVLSIAPGGAVVYNAADVDVALDKITFLDARYREDLIAYCVERNLAPSTAGLLEDARARGLTTLRVPFEDISTQLAAEVDVPKSVADRTLNSMAVAVSTAMLGYDRRHTYASLERTFAGREKIINLNVASVNKVYDFVRGELDSSKFTLRLAEGHENGKRLFVGGSQVVAMGKLAGGLAFQTYYPISPATDESVYLEGHASFPTTIGDEGAVTVVQTEDELSAMTMATGAALTGARSATATSGPGFSLMAEALGWAATNEVPVVLTVWQRGGPSTGLPTRTEQGDLTFAVAGGHGDFPKIVLSSGDLIDAFYDAAEAFNYADRFQVPVIHLVDKQIASTTQTIPEFDMGKVKIDRGQIMAGSANGSGPYERFRPTESGITPRSLMGQPGGTHWVTGGEHTNIGRVTEDPVIREQQMEKRMRKMDTILKELAADEKVHVVGPDDAALTLLSWGATKGVIQETIDLLAGEGIGVRSVQVRLLWPFPIAEVTAALDGRKPIVGLELNFSGQLARLLRQETGRAVDHLVVKYNGRPVSARELSEALRAIHSGGADERIVLRNPYE